MGTVKSFKKGIKMFKKESAAREMEAVSSMVDTESGNSLHTNLVINEGKPNAADIAREGGNEVLAEILEMESGTSCWKVGLMFLTTGGMLVLTILKGGGSVNPLSITCGSWQYWVITLAALPFVLTISIIARNHL